MAKSNSIGSSSSSATDKKMLLNTSMSHTVVDDSSTHVNQTCPHRLSSSTSSPTSTLTVSDSEPTPSTSTIPHDKMYSIINKSVHHKNKHCIQNTQNKDGMGRWMSSSSSFNNIFLVSIMVFWICLVPITRIEALNSNGNSDYDSSEEKIGSTTTATLSEPVPESLRGKCMFKDTCETKSNLVGDVNVPCLESHDPHKIDEESLSTLRSICPDLFESEDDDPYLCCDADQVYELEQSFAIPRQLGLDQCPSCSQNWRSNFCQLTCSPKQSDFIRVINTTQMDDGRIRIDTAEYHMTSNYADGLYESCKNVKGLAPGQFLLDLMCGQWGSKFCTSQKWLDFMGKSVENDGQAPFQLNYILHNYTGLNNGELKPMDIRTFKCSEAPSAKDNPCSCTDCEETCSLKKLPEDKKFLPESKPPVSIIGMSGVLFAAIFLFIFLVILILGYFSAAKFHHKRSQTREYHFYFSYYLLFSSHVSVCHVHTS